MPINRGRNGTPEYEPSDSDDEEGKRRPKRQCGFRDEVEGDELRNWKVHPQAVPSAPREIKLHRPKREEVWLEEFEDKEQEVRIKKSDAELLLKHLVRTSPWYMDAMVERTQECQSRCLSGLEVHQHFSNWLHMFKEKETQRLEEATNMSHFFAWFISWFCAPCEAKAAGAYQWMLDEMKRTYTNPQLPDAVHPSPDMILHEIDKWREVYKTLHHYAL